MPAIVICCKLNRPANTPVDMGDGTVYTFNPDADGNLTCVVANADHQAKLLAISEGYVFHAPADMSIVAPAAAPVAPTQAAAPVTPAPAPAPAAAQAADASKGGEGNVAFDPATTTDTVALEAWANESPENSAQLRAMHTTELESEPRANARNETIAAKLTAKRSA